MLNPLLLYANKTFIGRNNVYHIAPLDKSFRLRLLQADSIVTSSELYNAQLTVDVCLKDGSAYPGLIEKVLGRDMLASFYNKIIFTGDIVDYGRNYIERDGHKWNLIQMVAHAQVHCLEFKKLGFFKANPLGKHPSWKWEGYPEYIARQPQAANLSAGISALLQAERAGGTGWMALADGTETLIVYHGYMLLVQYCMQVKKMSFLQLLADTASEETIRRQMMDWYARHAG